MSHVKIASARVGSGFTISVDGVALENHVLFEGFHIEWPTDHQEPVRVHMVLAADAIEVDLPTAVVSATRQEVDSDE